MFIGVIVVRQLLLLFAVFCSDAYCSLFVVSCLSIYPFIYLFVCLFDGTLLISIS